MGIEFIIEGSEETLQFTFEDSRSYGHFGEIQGEIKPEFLRDTDLFGERGFEPRYSF